jgi:putative ABC transport system permease protein
MSQPFDEDVVIAAEDVPGVAQAEGRGSISGRVQGPEGQWIPIQMTAIPPLDEMEIDQLRPAQGTTGPLALGDQEIFIERTGRGLMPVQVGDVVQVELPDRRVYALRVAGVVHDPTAFSSYMSGQVNAYVSLDTLEWLGGSRDYNQMYVTVAERADDEAHVKAVAQRVADKIERTGRRVFITLVFEPGHHPTRSVTETLGVILNALGALSVFLSAFLVVNTLNALLSQHVRQIGVMKSIGARTGQIVGMYVALVLGFGVLALLIAVPLSTLAASLMVSFLSELLNFRPAGFRLLPGSLALQIIVALVVPVGAALVPVLNGARVTIRQAISDYGLGADRFGRGRIDRLVERVRGLPRPLLISLRNTFRRKARLILTLSTLTLGGAIFIAVFNVRASFYVTIEDVLGYFLSDVNFSLAQSRRIEKVEQITQGIAEVERIEGWEVVTGQILAPDEETGLEVAIWAPPAGSDLIEPVLIDGRWLVPEDENAMVISNHVISERPDLEVGDELHTKIDDKEYAWRVVGIVEMPGNFVPPFVYVNYEYLTDALHRVGRASAYRVVTTEHDVATQERVAAALEQRFDEAGVPLAGVTTGVENEEQQKLSIDILINTLMVMALLIALVGGIGLMGTMSLNVIERTREIGVMRSIGASNRAILGMVVFEGALIGLISWLLGVLVSLPMTLLLDQVIGVSFVHVPLTFIVAPQGLGIWLLMALGISALASLLPARNAVRLTIREVLAYE